MVVDPDKDEVWALLRGLARHIDAVETELAQIRTMHRANVTLHASTTWPAEKIPPEHGKVMRRHLVQRLVHEIADRLDLGLVTFHTDEFDDGMHPFKMKRLTATITVQSDPLAADGYERGRTWRGPNTDWPDDLIEMMAFDIWRDLPVGRRRPYVELLQYEPSIWSLHPLDRPDINEQVAIVRKAVVEIRDGRDGPFPRLVAR